MDGKLTAQLLAVWDEGNHLTDSQLKTLEEGLSFLVSFCSESKLSPLTVYYHMKCGEIRRCIAARKEK